MVKRPAEVGILANDHLCRVILAVLDEIHLALNQRVELLLAAGIHKEHQLLITHKLRPATDEILLDEIQIQLNVRAQNIVADDESVALGLAHNSRHILFTP